jgi:hypothetical protein
LKELAKSGDLGVDLATAFDASPNPYMLLTPTCAIAGVNEAYLTAPRHDARGDHRQAGVRRLRRRVPAKGSESVRQVQASLERRETGEPDHLALVRFSIPVRDANGEDRPSGTVLERHPHPAPERRGRGPLRPAAHHRRHRAGAVAPARRRDHEPASALEAIVGGGMMERARLVQEDNRRLEVERNRLIDMFMQAPGFVAVLTGPTHVFEMVNPAYAQLIGHRDVSGKPIREALPELEGQGYYEFLDDVYETGEPFEGKESLVQLQRRPAAR